MGTCASCTSTATTTSKLILQDGNLQEFSHPVKVSYILSKHPNIFVCNSDEMEFDNVINAVNEDEELQLGQLYFALPLNKLSRPLQAVEMAALAVKANAALLRAAGGEKCRCRKKTAGGLFGGGGLTRNDLRSTDMMRRRNCNNNGGRSTFMANNNNNNNLSVIPE